MRQAARPPLPPPHPPLFFPPPHHHPRVTTCSSARLSRKASSTHTPTHPRHEHPLQHDTFNQLGPLVEEGVGTPPWVLQLFLKHIVEGQEWDLPRHTSRRQSASEQPLPSKKATQVKGLHRLRGGKHTGVVIIQVCFGSWIKVC